MAEPAAVEILPEDRLEEVRPLLLDLLVEDQGHYGSRLDRTEIEGGLLGEIRPSFAGGGARPSRSALPGAGRDLSFTPAAAAASPRRSGWGWRSRDRR